MSDFDPNDFDAAAQSIKNLIADSQAAADEAVATTMAKFEVDEEQLIAYFETVFHSSPEEYAESIKGENDIAFEPEDFDVIDSDEIELLIDEGFDNSEFDSDSDAYY